jgi:uncharacterized protein with HEPN domain
MDFADYARTWHVRRAVARGVEIISEASRHLPDELKEHYPAIYWQEIASIGNLLRHDYGRIDNRIMWRIVEKYLPELKEVVIDMLAREAKEGPANPTSAASADDVGARRCRLLARQASVSRVSRSRTLDG